MTTQKKRDYSKFPSSSNKSIKVSEKVYIELMLECCHRSAAQRRKVPMMEVTAEIFEAALNNLRENRIIEEAKRTDRELREFEQSRASKSDVNDPASNASDTQGTSRTRK